MTSSVGDFEIPLASLRRRSSNPYRYFRRVHLDNLSTTSSSMVDNQVEMEFLIGTEGRQVVVAGSLRTDWVGECRRCLQSLTGSLDLDVREVFSKGRGMDSEDRGVERSSEEADSYPLGSENLDLKPMVRDAILLALPLSLLCGTDCQGPDPERFPTAGSKATSYDEDEKAGDPRWSVLDALRELPLD